MVQGILDDGFDLAAAVAESACRIYMSGWEAAQRVGLSPTCQTLVSVPLACAAISQTQFSTEQSSPWVGQRCGRDTAAPAMQQAQKKSWDPAVLSPTGLWQMPSNTLFALQWLVDRHDKRRWQIITLGQGPLHEGGRVDRD